MRTRTISDPSRLGASRSPSSPRLFGVLLLGVATLAGCEQSEAEPDPEVQESESSKQDRKRDAQVDADKPDAKVAQAAPKTDATTSKRDAMASDDEEHAHDALQHCRSGFPADPRDETMSGEPLEVTVEGGGRDLLVPQEVLDWMDERAWSQTHDDWHNIRRWDSGCKKSNAPAEGCASAQRLLAAGLWRAPIQERAPGDGYAFLVMHRHMIQALKQAFPRHASLFSGFSHVPRSSDDAENPTPWREIVWTSKQLVALDILDNIEDHLDQFPTEDELGLYMESPIRWTEENYSVDTGDASAGIHPMLHYQWSVAGSPGDLGAQPVNNKNYIFYKFHSWMDDVWERYRKAKGIRDDDPDYQEELYAQCKEMHDLDARTRKRPDGDAGVAPPPSAPPEIGFFAQRVRPILERSCVTCHGATAPEAELTLAGMDLSSAAIVKGLVGVDASNGQYPLVAPGDPEKSWLYLKLSGGAETAECSDDCNRMRMPAGKPLSDDDLIVIRQWIVSGAPGPV